MSEDRPSPLNRKLLWSLGSTLFLLFVSSTSTLSNVHEPERSFSLGLEQAFGSRFRLDDVVVGASSGPMHAARAAAGAAFVLDAPRRWSLRPEESPALDGYVRSLPFGREIDDAARRHEIDVLLLASIVEAESSFRPDAVSPKGALGLMQLMPLHFSGEDRPLDPQRNLEVGARYLDSLRERYDGDLELALAAYHAGPGTIERYGGAPPWRETQRYVARVLTLYREHQENLAEVPAAL